jgi:hypothetical protein
MQLFNMKAGYYFCCQIIASYNPYGAKLKKACLKN